MDENGESTSADPVSMAISKASKLHKDLQAAIQKTSPVHGGYDRDINSLNRERVALISIREHLESLESKLRELRCVQELSTDDKQIVLIQVDNLRKELADVARQKSKDVVAAQDVVKALMEFADPSSDTLMNGSGLDPPVSPSRRSTATGGERKSLDSLNKAALDSPPASSKYGNVSTTAVRDPFSISREREYSRELSSPRLAGAAHTQGWRGLERPPSLGSGIASKEDLTDKFLTESTAAVADARKAALPSPRMATRELGRNASGAGGGGVFRYNADLGGMTNLPPRIPAASASVRPMAADLLNAPPAAVNYRNREGLGKLDLPGTYIGLPSSTITPRGEQQRAYGAAADAPHGLPTHAEQQHDNFIVAGVKGLFGLVKTVTKAALVGGSIAAAVVGIATVVLMEANEGKQSTKQQAGTAAKRVKVVTPLGEREVVQDESTSRGASTAITSGLG